MIEIILGSTYYKSGFFNIGVAHQNLIGEHNTPITIQLGDNPHNIIQGTINRTANNNFTPRIMGRVPMRDWIQSNFNLFEIMTVQVLNPQSIVLIPN